jgi:DNA-binding response OmpR family regulator
VLIVDDSRMARLMLRNAVESLGHETLEACDGQQAWDMLVRTGVDVVVSDWMMPSLEGPELCRRVRAQEDGSYTYFILLTTLADRRSALEGMEAGADDYLPKPLDVGELQLRLIAAQRITQLHKELLERDKHLRYLSLSRRWSENFVHAACLRPRVADRWSRATST